MVNLPEIVASVGSLSFADTAEGELRGQNLWEYFVKSRDRVFISDVRLMGKGRWLDEGSDRP